MTPISFTVVTPTMTLNYLSPQDACDATRANMRDGTPVQLITTFRTMTPLGPVNRKTIARY